MPEQKLTLDNYFFPIGFTFGARYPGPTPSLSRPNSAGTISRAPLALRYAVMISVAVLNKGS